MNSPIVNSPLGYSPNRGGPLVAPLLHCHALTVMAGESIVVEGIILKGIATRQLQIASVLFAIGLAA